MNRPSRIPFGSSLVRELDTHLEMMTRYECRRAKIGTRDAARAEHGRGRVRDGKEKALDQSRMMALQCGPPAIR